MICAQSTQITLLVQAETEAGEQETTEASEVDEDENESVEGNDVSTEETIEDTGSFVDSVINGETESNTKSVSEMTTDELFEYIMSLTDEELEALYNENPDLEERNDEFTEEQQKQLAEKFGNSEDNIDVISTNTTWQNDWTYVISGSYIWIRAYNGSATTYTVPSSATVGGTTYRTKIGNYGGSGAQLNTGTIKNLTFEDGIYLDSNLTYLFYQCSNLINLNLKNFNTSSVTNMNSMFSDCSNLKMLNISNFDVSKVTNMTSMFQGLKSVTWLDLTSFKTNNSILTEGDTMFANSTKLANIYTTSDFQLYSIFQDGYDYAGIESTAVFYNCTSLPNYPKLIAKSGAISTEKGGHLTYTTATTYSITYNANGGTISKTSESVTGATGISYLVTLPSVSSRTYYNFKGWYEGNTRVGGSGEIATLSGSNHTLTAQWEGKTYTNYLYYNANGGSGGPSTQSATVTYPNTSKSFTLSSTVPTRTGYTFNGWYTASSGGTKVTGSTTVGNASNAGNQSKTLYAQWSANSYTNTLNYDANGGTGAPSSQTAKVTYPNTQSTFTLSSTVPTKTGYTFTGWYNSASDGTQISGTYTLGNSSEANNQSATLYAQWEKLTNVTIKNTVTGNLGDQYKQFEYKYTDSSNTEITKTLKSGESVTVTDLTNEEALKLKDTVKQTDYSNDGYVTTSSTDITDDEITISYVNKKNSSVPTAEHTSYNIMFWIVGISGLLLLVGIITKTRKFKKNS